MSKVDTARAKQAARATALLVLFVVSFLLFLVMTFPYEVLKESIAANLTKATGFNVAIGDMGASLPFGIKMEKVKIEGTVPGIAIDLKTLKVDISVLRLLIAQLGVSVELTAGKGSLVVTSTFGLFDLVAGGQLPKRVTVESKNFPLDEIISFALSNAANSPTANPMVAPILATIGVSALLNAGLDFSLDPKNLPLSTGQADIQLASAILKLSHPSIGLKDQRFAKAQLKAKLDGGVLTLDKVSGFIADELELIPEGKITLKQQIAASQLDLKILFKLTNDLKTTLGFLLGNGSANGEGQVTTQVRGTIDQPVTMNL